MASRILLLEPYDGGSHARFLDELVRQFPDCEFDRLSLPARRWKWRMRYAAIDFAEKLRRDEASRPAPDVVLASTFLNLAEFRALAPPAWTAPPFLLYFHENQLAYPNRVHKERDLHYGITNLVSALAADRCLFNTEFNRLSFLDALAELLSGVSDMKLLWAVERVRERSEILPVPLDLEHEPASSEPRPSDRPPLIVWNHRWEHDKNPEDFFAALELLASEGLEFEVAVAGQDFADRPEVFDRARASLGPRITQWGAVEDRGGYLELLRRSLVCVSTARHEFQGLSVLEAAAQGCHLLVPERLSYPELFPERSRYRNQGELVCKLRRHLQDRPPVDPEIVACALRFSWSVHKPRWEALFRQAAAGRPDSPLGPSPDPGA